jgi:predicted NUDIX family phosphoesterase
MGKMDEIIIVVPRMELFEDEMLAFQGTESRQRNIVRLMNNIGAYYTAMRRGDAEENVAFKQPIPYAVIRRGNEFYMYERLSGGGEGRLHNKLSLGAGGHMNPIEGVHKFSEVLSINLDRELEEELDITDKNAKINIIGFINDDSDEVGQVHVGVLCTVDIAEDAEVTVRETEQLAGRWITLEELKSDEIYSRLENWSKIVVNIM